MSASATYLPIIFKFISEVLTCVSDPEDHPKVNLTPVLRYLTSISNLIFAQLRSFLFFNYSLHSILFYISFRYTTQWLDNRVSTWPHTHLWQYSKLNSGLLSQTTTHTLLFLRIWFNHPVNYSSQILWVILYCSMFFTHVIKLNQLPSCSSCSPPSHPCFLCRILK